MEHINTKKIAVIMGNGPSLRGFNFPEELKNIDTFGMNAAYRYWNDIGWYPTYYSCLDPAVGECHKEEIARLIQNQDTNKIKKFILRANVIKYLQKNGFINENVINFDFWYIRNKLTGMFSDFQTTGSFTALWAAVMGYNVLLLIGIDANFPSEKLAEAKICDVKNNIEKISPQKTTLLQLTDTPQVNQNYFFDGYQKKGDFYFMANKDTYTENYIHIKSWEFIPDAMKKYNCKIINANPESKLPFFPKCTWNEAKSLYIQ